MIAPHATPVYDTLAAVLPRVLPSFLGQNEALVRWIPGQTPWSTAPAVFLTGVLYLCVIHGGRALQKRLGLKPLQIKGIFVVHNVMLSLMSGLLLAAFLEEIIPIWSQHGFYHAICARESWTPRMETLYIINYMMKYLELIDTVFMMLKGKPMPFLHVYHHSATALLCFSQLLGRTSVSWVVITLNLFVHLIMYAYYALTTLRIPCPWKRAVTTMQIVQFILDLSIVYFATWEFFTTYFNSSLPQWGHCPAAVPHAAISGVVILSSYLLLFISFYSRTYNKPAKRAAGAVRGASEKQPLLSEKAQGSSTSHLRPAHADGDARKRPTTPQLEHAI